MHNSHNLWDDLETHINGFFEKIKLEGFNKTKFKFKIIMKNQDSNISQDQEAWLYN